MNAAITLHHLRCFIETARCGSPTEAARRLDISQTAANNCLSELENLVGYQLFDAQDSKFILNDKGKVFLRYAEAADIKLKQGFDALSGADDRAREQISIGALPSVAGSLIPKCVQNIRLIAPELLIRIDSGNSRDLLKRLHANRLDLVVGRMPDPSFMRGLHFEHLYSDRLAFVVNPTHQLLKLKSPTLADVLKYPCILPESTAVIRPLVDRFLRFQGCTLPPDRVETTSPAFCTTYIIQSEAVWFISRGVASALVEQGTCAFLEVDTTTTIGSIGVITKFGEELSSASLLFLDNLRAQI